jgi:hypothetical protein
MRKLPVLERILAPGRLEITEGGCWRWLGSLDQNGYGLVNHGGTTRRVTHVFWEETIGPLPEGLEPDHLCHDPGSCSAPCPHRACFNPDHLDWVTHRVNTLRGDTITARWAARINCHICGGTLYRSGTRRCRRSRYSWFRRFLHARQNRPVRPRRVVGSRVPPQMWQLIRAAQRAVMVSPRRVLTRWVTQSR